MVLAKPAKQVINDLKCFAILKPVGDEGGISDTQIKIITFDLKALGTAHKGLSNLLMSPGTGFIV